MAESNEQFCNVCDVQHVTKSAVHWCPECEEGLCEDCLKHHNASKYTRSHEVISIDNHRLLLPHVDTVIQYCTDHGNKYQVYCPEHESLCCIDCLSPSHDKCAGILSIYKLVKNAKSSTLLSDIERGIREIKLNLERISEEKRENISRIMTQRQKICQEIKSFRNKINHQLDIIENELINDLDAKEKTIKLKIETLMSKLNKKAAQLQNLHVIKDHGTDFQAFFVSKSLVKSVETEEIYVKSLFDGNALQQYDLGLVIDDHMSQFVSSFKRIGTITCSESSTTVTFHTEKEKEAQILNPIREKSIHRIRHHLIRTLPVSGYQSELSAIITGCTANTNGKVLLVKKLNRKGYISNELKRYMLPRNMCPGKVKRTPKMHKPNIPYQLIISGINHLTEKIAEYAEKELQHNVQSLPSYIQDTTDFLTNSKKFNNLFQKKQFYFVWMSKAFSHCSKVGRIASLQSCS